MIGRWKGKVGLEVLESSGRVGNKGGNRQRKRRWEEDGAEPRGLEKLKVARGLLAGVESRVVVELPNLGTRSVINTSGLCVFHTGLLRFKIPTTPLYFKEYLQFNS